MSDIMSTNQSVPWSMYKYRGNRKEVAPQTSGRNSPQPQQEPSYHGKTLPYPSQNASHPCTASHAPPANPEPHCCAYGDKESSYVPMETPNATGIDTRSCCGATVNPSAARCKQSSTSISVIPGDADNKTANHQQPFIDSVTMHLTESDPLPFNQESLAMLPEYGEEEELPDELESQCSGDEEVVSIKEPVTSDLCGREKKPALVPSLFPRNPPTLYFGTAKENVELLPVEQRKLLKWKMSSVTPSVVKDTLTRSHFKASKKSHDWLGCWGQHLKSRGFRTIREHQKLNHFPGSFQIGRKDRLWHNLSKMQTRFGKKEFNFFPRSFVLPHDVRQLREAWDKGRGRRRWIVKPPASARGIGIQVIHKWSQIPKRRPLLVQRYIHRPYLISGNKFDLRIYVYVSSYDPLRIYIYSDGLVRFASCKYSSSVKTLRNKFMHLTNYSVNKKNSDYQSNSDDKACQGHKWSLKALWQYLGTRGVNTILIWEKIKDIVIKTIIASEPYINTLVKMYVRSPNNCHELFGFDIMLDEKLKPWLLEVNISPSLHTSTALDFSVKGQMIRDLLNLAGFVLPQHEDAAPASSCSTSSSASSLSGGERDRSKISTEHLLDDRIKRAHFTGQRSINQTFLSTVLTVLTPNDVRVLTQAEDELNRRGDFERVFPSSISGRYLRFFEQRRYLNILLSQWELKYCNNRSKGIDLLRSLCQKGVHLGSSCSSEHLVITAFSSISPISLPSSFSSISSEAAVSQKQSPQPDDDDVQSERSSSPDTGSITSSSTLSSESVHTKDLE
ncbi:tubulin polyglutamylase TTLL4 [Megalops cyprinoides]|uniref:tubulin polyglutamylase TTLL4 n=1 Tax=Megalops cyprinoides TaxID=118141 RepID=UPI00186565C1|nr:tubulin polyglutamylase TTLL4 [Megalops cyprinoides]